MTHVCRLFLVACALVALGLGACAQAGDGAVDWGAPDGDLAADAPDGFADGSVRGKVYFLRLKTENNGAWNAHNDGTVRLLAFLRYGAGIPAHARPWVIDAKLLAAYLDQGERGVPSFIYVHADERLTLSEADAALLKRYLDMGGFLFIDSRPSLTAKNAVSAALAQVLPDAPLAPLPDTHPINTFRFDVKGPKAGENLIEGQNYGITVGDRLCVFYTMGNFAHLYSIRDFGRKDVPEFVTSTYQMGANVMLYAITQGDATRLRTGAVPAPPAPPAPTAPPEVQHAE